MIILHIMYNLINQIAQCSSIKALLAIIYDISIVGTYKELHRLVVKINANYI